LNRWLAASWTWDYGAIYNSVKSNNALNSLIDLKSQWATFGALSNQELKFISDYASAKLNMTQTDTALKKNIDEMIKRAENIKSDMLEWVQSTNNTWNTQANVYNDASDYLKSLWY
jgi:hypothetical protein